MELTAERYPRVFVSHNSADKPLSRRVARRLHHAGAEVILDEIDLEPGQPLTESLSQEIDRSTHLVVIWTATAAASEWVRREVEFARSKPLFFSQVLPDSGDSIKKRWKLFRKKTGDTAAWTTRRIIQNIPGISFFM